MSRSEETTVECPKCTSEQSFTHWQSVNVTLDPDLKEKILDRTLVTFTCENCGYVAEVYHPLLYHDMEQRLMVFLGDEAPDASTSEDVSGSLASSSEAEYTFRLVSSSNELIEKILIRDAGLDDRVVEVFKLLLLEQLDESSKEDDAELFFSGIVREGDAEAEMDFELMSDSGTTGLSVPFEDTFRKVEAEVCHGLPTAECQGGKWIRVDEEYALDFLESDDSDPDTDNLGD
ncbi:MAG: CpXC domain-containing protein [Thermoguttaceae bacterium]|jgi:predicted nucleic-acid-binding Zn-ribbon protein|nr:CpXC domain-containing protein [Thermoguttaceae bacterium]